MASSTRDNYTFNMQSTYGGQTSFDALAGGIGRLWGRLTMIGYADSMLFGISETTTVGDAYRTAYGGTSGDPTTDASTRHYNSWASGGWIREAHERLFEAVGVPAVIREEVHSRGASIALLDTNFAPDNSLMAYSSLGTNMYKPMYPYSWGFYGGPTAIPEEYQCYTFHIIPRNPYVFMDTTLTCSTQTSHLPYALGATPSAPLMNVSDGFSVTDYDNANMAQGNKVFYMCQVAYTILPGGRTYYQISSMDWSSDSINTDVLGLGVLPGHTRVGDYWNSTDYDKWYASDDSWSYTKQCRTSVFRSRRTVHQMTERVRMTYKYCDTDIVTADLLTCVSNSFGYESGEDDGYAASCSVLLSSEQTNTAFSGDLPVPIQYQLNNHVNALFQFWAAAQTVAEFKDYPDMGMLTDTGRSNSDGTIASTNPQFLYRVCDYTPNSVCTTAWLPYSEVRTENDAPWAIGSNQTCHPTIPSSFNVNALTLQAYVFDDGTSVCSTGDSSLDSNLSAGLSEMYAHPWYNKVYPQSYTSVSISQGGDDRIDPVFTMLIMELDVDDGSNDTVYIYSGQHANMSKYSMAADKAYMQELARAIDFEFATEHISMGGIQDLAHEYKLCSLILFRKLIERDTPTHWTVKNALIQAMGLHPEGIITSDPDIAAYIDAVGPETLGFEKIDTGVYHIIDLSQLANDRAEFQHIAQILYDGLDYTPDYAHKTWFAFSTADAANENSAFDFTVTTGGSDDE